MPKVKGGERGRVGGTGEYMGRGLGSRVTGRILKKGREERNPAARLGRCQRSRTERGVGWEGQENTWDVVWGAELQEGQLGLSARAILALYERREEQWPERSWERRVRWARGREVSEASMGGGWVDRTLLGGALERDCWTAEVWRDDRVDL